jgi:hypothetical protein
MLDKNNEKRRKRRFFKNPQEKLHNNVQNMFIILHY